jgi:FlaA1/EpsC-like NDP-sugar epimerase
MGASKMLCESMVREQYPRCEGQNYIIRFGNVMNTNGSVLQIWDRQFREGVSLTVTDLKMKRWLMPISDACDQILRVLGFDAGTYLLDMGEMHTVADILEMFLAERTSEPESIPLNFIGARLGEKLEEELFWSCEAQEQMRVGQKTIIRIGNSPSFDYHKALTVSGTFDDQITLRCLSKMFVGLKA